jgi:hypothetical protein
MDVKQEKITVARAEQLLGTNESNRRTRRRHVTKLRHAIEAGEWRSDNPAPIAVSSTGRLLDGQHRLLAVVEAKKGVTMWVARGVKPDVMPTIDTGHARTFADLLTMRGEVSATNMAAAVRQLQLYRIEGVIGGSSSRDFGPTHVDLLQRLQDEPGIRGSTLWSSAGQQHDLVVLRIPRGLASALHYLFSEVDEEDAEEFWRRLLTGDEIHEGEAVYALRRYLLRQREFTARLPARRMAALIIKAWKQWREGEQVDVIQWRGGGSKPDPFPTIGSEAA